MRKILLFGVISFLYSIEHSPALTLGKYKATSAYCTNPNYVYTPDEQAYIRSIQGEGSCKTGNFRDFPCFSDYYDFSDETHFSFLSIMTAAEGITSRNRLAGTYTRVDKNTLKLFFNPQSVQKNKPPSPAQQDPDGRLNDDVAELKYRMEKGQLLLLLSTDQDCGDYVLEYSPVGEIPE